MPYDKTKDLGTNTQQAHDSLGSKAEIVVPSDANDLARYAKGIEVVSSGDLVYLPTRNDDGDTITVTGAPVGYIAPTRVRRVLSTGTTATVIAVYD